MHVIPTGNNKVKAWIVCCGADDPPLAEAVVSPSGKANMFSSGKGVSACGTLSSW